MRTLTPLPLVGEQQGELRMASPDCEAITKPDEQPATALEKTLRLFSIVTLLLTVPQVITVWVGREVAGVSLVSWSAYLASACLWFAYGLQKGDRTIYLACIGWI